MVMSVVNALILGLVLIAGLNYCLQGTGNYDDITSYWQSSVGDSATLVFLIITLVAIECSNCANLTSAARMVYAFSRDNALPFSRTWYNIDKNLGAPVRAVWMSTTVAFIMGAYLFAFSRKYFITLF